MSYEKYSFKSLITINDKECIKKLGFVTDLNEIIIKAIMLPKYKRSFDLNLFRGKISFQLKIV